MKRRLVLQERDFSAAQRRRAADSGAAMPDGSFPISTRQDLKNALHLVGQAKDPAAARAHIAKRAKAIGAEDLLHESLDPLVEATVAALFESAALQEANLLDLPDDELHQLIDDVLDRVSEADGEEADEDEAEEDYEETGHTGVMVALPIPEYDALRLAVPGGEAPEDLHLTLAYLGEADDLDEIQQARIVVALDRIAHCCPPFEGDISGLGRFQGEPGGRDVIYASVDAPDLAGFRQQLCYELCGSTGVEPSMEHGFTPHITLAYVGVGEVAPIERVPSLHLEFDQLLVAFAGRHILLDLEGSVAAPSGMGYMHEAFVEAEGLDGSALLEAFEATSGGGAGGHPPLTAEHKAKISASLRARAAAKGKVNEDGSIEGETQEQADARVQRDLKNPPKGFDKLEPKQPFGRSAEQKQDDARRMNVKREDWDVPYREQQQQKADVAKVGKPAPVKAAAPNKPVTKATSAPAPPPKVSEGKGDKKKAKFLAKAAKFTKKADAIKEAAVPDRIDLLESAVDLLEKWHTKGRHLSSAHKAKISASLKARGSGTGPKNAKPTSFTKAGGVKPRASVTSKPLGVAVGHKLTTKYGEYTVRAIGKDGKVTVDVLSNDGKKSTQQLDASAIRDLKSLKGTTRSGTGLGNQPRGSMSAKGS